MTKTNDESCQWSDLWR